MLQILPLVSSTAQCLQFFVEHTWGPELPSGSMGATFALTTMSFTFWHRLCPKIGWATKVSLKLCAAPSRGQLCMMMALCLVIAGLNVVTIKVLFQSFGSLGCGFGASSVSLSSFRTSSRESITSFSG